MRLRLVAIFLLIVMLTGLLPWNLFIDRGEAISHGKIVILSNVDNSIPGIVDAYKKLQGQGYNFELKIFSGSDLVNSETVDKLKQEVQAANLLLMDMIGSSSYQTVINFLPEVPQTTKIVSIRSNVFSSVDRIDSSQDTVLKPYFDNGGPENMRRYLLYLLKNYCNISVNEAIDPLPAEVRFIYHPDALGSVERAVYENVYEDVYEDVYQGPSPQGTFTTFADYAYWYKKQGKSVALHKNL